MIKIKRAYEDVLPEDNIRVLVDRIWPRGIKKEELKLDFWYEELAPSTELRKWFNHEPERFSSFIEKYNAELLQNEKAMDIMKSLSEQSQNETITLIFGAKSYTLNQALVICSFMHQHFQALIDPSLEDVIHDLGKYPPS